MISFFRKALSSWIVLALLGLVLVAFIVTGIGDPFGGAGPAPGSLVKVGDRNITEAELTRQFDQMLARAREQNPTATAEQAARQGMVEQLADQLAGGAALEQLGSKLGVAYGETAVDREIAAIPAFQIAGRFDQGTYEAALAGQRLTDRELRESIRRDGIRGQMLLPVAYGAQAPGALAAPYASLLLESRRGAIATVPADRIGGIEAPTDAQVEAHYRANLRNYTIPERRAFRYALVSRDEIASGVSIPDADVKRYYDERRETYGGIEQRRLSQVVVQDQAAAQRIAARTRAGEDFAKLAAELAGYGAADLALGTLPQTRLAETTSAEIARAAFAQPAGGLVGPLRSEFGWHVVRVDAVVPGRARPIAEVRDEIVAALRAERVEDLLSDRVAEVEDALADGQSVTDVAKTYGLRTTDVPAVTRDGRTPASPGYALPPQAAALVSKAFDAAEDEEPSVHEIDKDSFAVLDVTDVIAPAPVPLAQIRQAVAADWTRDQRRQRARQVADAIVAEVARGTPLAQALAKRGMPAPRPFAGRRLDLSRQGQRVPPPLALMFTLPADAVRSLEAPNDLGYFIVKVDQIVPGDPAGVPGVLQGTQAQMSQTVGDELVAQFARAAEGDIGVERDPEAIRRLRQRYLGQVDPTEQ